MSLGEKSSLMAKAWQKMEPEERKSFNSCVGSEKESSDDEELLPLQKKRLVMRVAKRHQRDVSHTLHYSSIVIMLY